MSMSEALTAARVEQYFEEHYSRDDYYTQGQTTIGQWIGKGAADLGLTGDVSREDFTALLQGINPRSGAVLVPGATHNGEHRAGWDAQFSAPKSVSIQALVGEDHRLIEAHKRAVNRAVAEVEAFALGRQHGGSEYVITGNVVAAAFHHLAARPAENSEFGPDPQLHTHVVLLNVTKRPDGEHRSMDPIEIYRSQTFGGAIYLSELAGEVQKLGYQIQTTDSKGGWQLTGYTRDQVMAFSQRSQEIDRRMKEEGWEGPRAARWAALETRMAKGTFEESTLKKEWQQRAPKYGIDAKAHLWQALGRGDMNRGTSQDTQTALEFATKHTTERDAVVDRRDLEAAALRHSMGRVRVDGLRAHITAEQHRETLIAANRVDWHHAQGAFTTDEMVRLESENLAMRREGIGRAEPVSDADIVRQWALKRGLFKEHSHAAELTLTSRDRMTAIEGLAGTAKTYTVGAIREFAEAQDYAVRGFGMTSGSVGELKKVGLEARTVASLTSNPVPHSNKPQLWFIDESSLLTTRSTNQVLKLAHNEGAKVRMVGDQRQHLGIEAGHPMHQFLEDGMPVAELTTIMRQRDAELREAVTQASQGKAGAAVRAIDLLDEQQRLVEIPDAKERYQRIAEYYLQGHEAGRTNPCHQPWQR